MTVLTTSSGGRPNRCSHTWTRQESITNLYQICSGGQPDRCSCTNRGISHDDTYNKQWRSTGSMQPYLLKNSLRSTLLLLLRVAGAEKSNWLVFDWLVVFLQIAGVWYLYPESKHESHSSTIRYNFWHKEKHPYFKITWTIIFLFTTRE